MIFEAVTIVGAAIAAKRFLFGKKKPAEPAREVVQRRPQRWILANPMASGGTPASLTSAWGVSGGTPASDYPVIGSVVIMEMIDASVAGHDRLPMLQGCFLVDAIEASGFSASLRTIRSVNRYVNASRLPPIGLRVDNVPPMFVK